MTDDWDFDSEEILNEHLLYRRVPLTEYEFCEVTDVATGAKKASPATLRYDYDDAKDGEQEGLSVHRKTVLAKRERPPETVYDYEKYRALIFPAGAPRCVGVGVGVLIAPDPDEPDADLAAAHALVRTNTAAPRGTKKPKFPEWNRIRGAIADVATWYPPEGPVDDRE